MLKEIREHYGIPQSLFAGYLGITRSHLSMAESGKRNIPAASRLKLLPVFLAISKPVSRSKSKDEKLDKELAVQNEQLKKLVSYSQKKAEYKLQLLRRSLSKMKADQDRCLQILKNLPALKAEAKTIDKSLFMIIEHDARQLQSKTGLPAQLKLELQIQKLQAEILYLKNRS